MSGTDVKRKILEKGSAYALPFSNCLVKMFHVKHFLLYLFFIQMFHVKHIEKEKQ